MGGGGGGGGKGRVGKQNDLDRDSISKYSALESNAISQLKEQGFNL